MSGEDKVGGNVMVSMRLTGMRFNSKNGDEVEERVVHNEQRGI